ncbi:MAG: hypothetical protein QXG10_05095 [Candidatus Hadarchaeales archaeon]
MPIKSNGEDMTNFIFMLTHHDVTIKNALEVFEEVENTGLECIGCKNIGLPDNELKKLVTSMKDAGMKSFMEIVTYDKKETLEALKKADELEIDYLIGGMPFFTDTVMRAIKDEKLSVKYCPYVGGIVGHPCVLKGSIEYIIEDAKRTKKLGVSGINLLAYRHREEDPHELLREYIKQIKVPTIVAGDINSFERIREVTELGYWGFTIGGAVIEKKIVPKGSIVDQVKAVLEEVKKAEK